ncbi:MAG TPA: hypothetical protein VN821_01090 [Candidatus Udaeobacter sp.]|nr:hypothetical protein [Candidatus Udaeobacter sp.]
MFESTVVSHCWKRYSIVSPHDFVVGPPHKIDELPKDAVPYCFDFDRRCLICVAAPDVLDRPFLYQAQRERARSVVHIPYEELDDERSTPVLIFSPGRCGSTLFLRALQASGLPAVSEPDYFQQIVSAVGSSLDRGSRQQLLRKATALLSRQLGTRAPVIKLREQCNAAPLLISLAFSSVRIIFILRNPVDWAISRKRAFPMTSAQRAVLILRRTLKAVDRLRSAHDVRICHYEEFAKPEVGYFRDVASSLGAASPIPEDAIRAVLASDSQEETALSRRSLAGNPVDRRYIEEFKALWEAGA